MKSGNGSLMGAMAVVILGVLSCQASAGQWTQYMGIGRGYVECDAMVKRLNRFNWNAVEESDRAVLVHHVVATYPRWKQPAWQELNPKQHELLIRRLMSFAEQGGGSLYFDLRAPKPNEVHRKVQGNEYLTTWIVPEGLRIQMARQRLIWWLDDRPAPEGEQTIVRLLFPPDSINWNRLRQRYPKFALPENMPEGTTGFQKVFLVTDDLQGPRPGIHDYDARALLQGVYLMGNKGRYVSGSESYLEIEMSSGGIIGPFCSLIRK